MLEMVSREGEVVPFEAPVEVRGNIEAWLQRLVEGMQVGGWWACVGNGVGGGDAWWLVVVVGGGGGGRLRLLRWAWWHAAPAATL